MTRRNQQDNTTPSTPSHEALGGAKVSQPEPRANSLNVITTSVDGMFLLAQIYLNSLAGKRSPKAIRSALNDLSSDIEKYESAYDDAMKRIQKWTAP
ncbi:uncharacterized protein N7458_003166 [Penicillium daleae]|uniref:Uncharacterized protein n=1 Tax=Penicillium daleae TaxID=63821 RepID=A0AAD6CEU7_9EURO|nr:uncharacterized protein N7458_003166 [Penicillium daleae]KAJ5461614.1 hypothetical protein N7458_003166 [Penicillium daleae]